MKKIFIDCYSVLPLRDLVIFPGMIVPLFVGRQKSIKALEQAVQQNNKIILVSQKEANNDDPKPQDLYRVGVVCQVLQVLKLQDSTIKVLIEGKERVKITRLINEDEHLQAYMKPFNDKQYALTEEISATKRAIIDLFEAYTQLNTKINPEVIASIHNAGDDLSRFADIVSSHIILKVESKQEILEADSVVEKLEKILTFLQLEIELLKTENRIRSRVKNQIEKNQKDYYLNEQLKAIHKELGEEDFKEEVAELSEKIKKLKLSKETREKCVSELRKLKSMNPMSSEATVIRNYIDWIINLPWNSFSTLNNNLEHAEKVLNDEHAGLEKVKERILEYLAVNLRTNKLKSPIICLIGPPGVGKTSLVRSVSKATNREFIKVALGGLRDEAEIKGHRRTYIGSMPGKIIQAMKKAKKCNPVMLLDEIDKMGLDYRGDPASAMLEVLDPEQNHNFNDHYLEVDYDLSNVMFLATANSYEGIPRPLLDRMEIIWLSGYTEQEKLEIAYNHLLAKQLENHGLKSEELSITRESITEIIRYYTREAGVRGLDRNIAKICRKAVKELILSKSKTINIDTVKIHEYLGIKKYDHGQIEKENLVGVTNGLAYSEVGGDLLAIEALLLFGKGGEVKITGKLGDVMKESVQAALSYIRFRATEYGIKPNIFKNKDIHIHVPEGATPKDGPSAGIAMCTSIVSALSGIPVKRDIAMTGEVTLRGRVLPIGGLKEKLLAALRGGVNTVLIPKNNVKDLEDIPDTIKGGLTIIPVEHVDEVIKHALQSQPKPITWDESQDVVPPSVVVAH